MVSAHKNVGLRWRALYRRLLSVAFVHRQVCLVCSPQTGTERADEICGGTRACLEAGIHARFKITISPPTIEGAVRALIQRGRDEFQHVCGAEFG